jgi:hypothetical protein
MRIEQYDDDDDEKAQLAQIPPSVTELRWIDIPEESLPYTDYKDEYLRSPYTLDAMTLASRWAGLYQESEVYAFMAWPGIEDDRFAVQHSHIDPTSEEFKLRLNKIWMVRFNGLAEISAQKLKSGGVFEMVDGKKTFVPLSPRREAALVNQTETFWKATRLLQGESTEIVEKRGKSTEINIGQLIVQGAERLSPQVREIMGQQLTIDPLAMLSGDGEPINQK